MGNIQRKSGRSRPLGLWRRWRCLLVVVVLTSLWAATSPVWAAGRVQLELVTEGGVPIMAQQEWLRRLAEAGVSNLRIRTGRSLDKVGIVVRGTEAAPIYAVTGIIDSKGDVLLPGGRYRPRDVARLAQWLDELAKLGPPDKRPKRAAFGLTEPQFKEVHKRLSLSVGFSTKGMKRADVIRKIDGRMLLPLRTGADLAKAIQDDDVVAEELSNVSCGTALAYVVRPLGMCLVPRESDAGQLECVVTPAKPKMEAWPIGWEPEKQRHELVPALFEFRTINVQGYAATQLLDAVGKLLKVPVLLDYNAMARHGIEPEKAFITLPQRRTNYSLLLRRGLYQAGLKSELRVDEAKKPFLWVTTIKPI